MTFKKTAVLVGLGAMALSGSASAFTVFDSFGSFPDATWGGDGIPNDRVAASMQIVNGNDTVRVAMSATQRFFNDPLSDNGAAVYQANAGSNCGIATDPVDCPSDNQGALWNWNYFIDVAGGGTLGDYQIDLYYDLEAGPERAFGDLSGLGRINITAGLAAEGLLGLTRIEGSENNLFDFLSIDVPGIIDAPDVAFDPNAIGNYQYAITVTRTGFPVDTVAMEVNVVPIPAAVWLFGSGLGFLSLLRRKLLG